MPGDHPDQPGQQLEQLRGQDEAERGAVDRRPPAGQRERVRGCTAGPAASPVTTLRIVWSPLSCTRERTQGRPEVPAPAAPPDLSALPSRRLPGRLRVGRRRAVLGGELFQFGRVPGHGLGQQAAEPHVVLGHLAPAGVGDRDVRRARPGWTGSARRRRRCSTGCELLAVSRTYGLDRGHAVLAEPDRCRWRSCRHLPPAGQRHQVRLLRIGIEQRRRPARSACTGPASSGSGGRPR